MNPNPELLALKEECRRRAIGRDCFELRMQVAEVHEQLVCDLLRQAGWTCEGWGQGLLSKEMRQALRGTRDCPVRWAPDLLAVRGAEWCFIDAKTETRTDTGNFTLEKSALAAHYSWWASHDHGTSRFIYVWDDFRCSYMTDLNEQTMCTGPYHGNGSGTPFWLIAKHTTRPFESVFAPRLEATG